MRIIKFRAWDSLNNKMTPVIDVSQSRQYWEFDWLGQYDFPIMQYTGLKDKNGKEIYEGDILKETTQGYPSSNFDSEEIWSFTDMRELWHRLDPVVGWGHNEVEVIGNIYQNPELLNNHPS
jgi:hypothetical protein